MGVLPVKIKACSTRLEEIFSSSLKKSQQANRDISPLLHILERENRSILQHTSQQEEEKTLYS
jgi:hypothetical protein